MHPNPAEACEVDDHAPAHFLPQALDRDALWTALPAAVQAHIQQHNVASPASEAAELFAIGELTWALRFQGAGAYKV